MVDAVLRHKLLGAAPERLGFRRELGRLRLGEQGSNPAEHPLVARAPRDRPAGPLPRRVGRAVPGNGGASPRRGDAGTRAGFHRGRDGTMSGSRPGAPGAQIVGVTPPPGAFPGAVARGAPGRPTGGLRPPPRSPAARRRSCRRPSPRARGKFPADVPGQLGGLPAALPRAGHRPAQDSTSARLTACVQPGVRSIASGSR